MEGARGRDRQSGTTLVEALVVVAITALVSLIGFPRLQQGLTRLSQRQTVSAEAERLREARAGALRGDRSVTFKVAANGRAYG
ncbi:MAG: prepilin-type N-terminal cleavage/methylation domain-containing protein, partial [Caulobacteraceae bacterium]|nr:prepilin-type N-terminal cleavage/methylation domain-containing protein [Caulobacteraceae bacterium]